MIVISPNPKGKKKKSPDVTRYTGFVRLVHSYSHENEYAYVCVCVLRSGDARSSAFWIISDPMILSNKGLLCITRAHSLQSKASSADFLRNNLPYLTLPTSK